MKHTSLPEKRHQDLVKVLQKSGLYRFSDGTERFNTNKYNSSESWANISTQDINNAVVLVVDILNLSGGSIGDFNLYSLLKAYFKDSKKRTEINSVVNQTK